MDRNLRRARAICGDGILLIITIIYFHLNSYFGGLCSETTQVERPQNGVSSHVLPGSTVAQRVLAKHIPGKSVIKRNKRVRKKLFKTKGKVSIKPLKMKRLASTAQRTTIE
jgi:hypothetical protein